MVKDAAPWRYLLINHAGEKLNGMSRGKVMGRTSHDSFARETMLDRLTRSSWNRVSAS